MLGGGGQLIVAARRRVWRRGARAGRRAQAAGRAGARGAQALRHRAARRDRARRRSARLRHRRGAVRPSAALRACASWPARPSSGATASICRRRPRPSSWRSPPGSARRPWRELVDELRNDAPDPGELLDVYREELDRARDFVVGARPRGGAGQRRWTWCRRRRSWRRWCRSPPTSRRRSISRRPGRPVLCHRRPIRRCRPRSLAQQRRGPLPPRHSGDGGARGVSGPPPPARDRAGSSVRGPPAPLDAGHGRGMGALLRAAHGRGGLLPDARAAALPAGEPALARHPGGARRRPAHPGHDAGGGGGLHGGAPADRAAGAPRPRCAATAPGRPTSSATP